MRIRKRPAISTLHLSDLQLADAHTAPNPSSSSFLSPPSTLDHYQPSDQTLPLIGKLNNGYDSPSIVDQSGVHKHHPLLNLKDEKVRGKEKENEENKSNHISKGDILVVSDQVLTLPQSNDFAQDGRCCEGEETIPLKKRKGRLEENIGIVDGKKVKAKMKMNKKCASMGKLDNDDEDEESEKKVNNNTKKRVTKRGNALMEGSRCSRVNGRGWRCCQQTLVGYSLCEHHLGKGRLRSMTSVRNRSSIGFSSSTTSAPNNYNVVVVVDNVSSSNSDIEKEIIVDNMDGDDDDEEDEKKLVVITNKRMKLGMVKARSISSLLGQADNKVAAIVDEKNSK